MLMSYHGSVGVRTKLFCLYSWASGALDPERTESTDVVTSVKRYAHFLSKISSFGKFDPISTSYSSYMRMLTAEDCFL